AQGVFGGAGGCDNLLQSPDSKSPAADALPQGTEREANREILMQRAGKSSVNAIKNIIDPLRGDSFLIDE
ncbi:hypothetical protein, partial [Bacteroides timonensis]|uniref:hypothetical protein n=1 Tax=Bacteroides timonensis TaxID=1470345 RepID=UPI0005C7624A